MLATAISAQSPLIVTFNLRDFPSESLQAWQITALHPSHFLIELYRQDPRVVSLRLFELVRGDRTFAEVLDRLRRVVPTFAALVANVGTD